MFSYEIYGECLASELSFPELRPSIASRPRWTLTMSDDVPASDGVVLLGEEVLEGAIASRLFRCADRYRLVLDDTGTFDITDDSTRIVWYPKPGAHGELARIDVMMRALPTALHAAGTVCLHGSAIAVDGSAVGFLGPKGAGKSTLAAALVRAGATLLTDDTLPVTPSEPPMARPGVVSLRLRRDAVDHLRLDGDESAIVAGGKQAFHHLAPKAVTSTPVPLAALYLLETPAQDRGAFVERKSLGNTEAAIRLVRESRIARLLGGKEAGELVTRTANIARLVPVYALEIARGLEHLEDVVGRLLEWHCPTGRTPEADSISLTRTVLE